MSYSNQNTKIAYNGNGAQITFGINFYYMEGESSCINTELWDYTNPNVPVQQPFILGTDYQIDESNFPATNVITTIPVAIDYKLIIYRSMPTTQGTVLTNGPFPSEAVEEQFDKAMMVSQEQEELLGRAVLSPMGGPELTTEMILEDIAETQPIKDRLDTNEATLVTQADAIADNMAQIAENTHDISELGDTSQLEEDIGDLQDEQIVQNTAIGNNVTAITALQTTVRNLTSASVFNAAHGDICLVLTSDAVDIVLPTPTINHKVMVKVEASFNARILGNIDGNATEYLIQSAYESVNLIANGIKWFII